MRLEIMYTVGGFIEVDSQEQADEYKQKIKDNDFADIEDKITSVHFESDAWMGS